MSALNDCERCIGRHIPVPDVTPVRSTEEVDSDLAKLWHAWRSTHEQELRNRLLVHYSPLVRQVASRVAVGLPAQVEFSDLVSAGVLGLLDAIERFDPTRGAPFEAYAMLRIRGAVLDELRAQDWVPRLARQRQRNVAQVVENFVATHGHYPSTAHIAHISGLTTQQVSEALEQSWFSAVQSLDEVVLSNSDERPRHESLIDPQAPDPETQALQHERHEQVRAAVVDLPEREAKVIDMYYGDHLTLKEIGDILGVTESRASQLRSRALVLLKARMHTHSAA
ncbi:MAG: FliA/WhiG family RNA polymerase sigma factor [Actinobacteria bacterium]|nr:FliA/WhiG family RNA polymerase sigma factor [Actinomycetota bacterium]